VVKAGDQGKPTSSPAFFYFVEQIINNWEENLKELLDNSVILHKPTLEFLIKKRARDEIYLFIFYCYCSKLQRNYKKIWASNDFVRKNLNIRKQDLLKAKKNLIEWGIIEVEPYKEKLENSNKKVIKKWFVKIKPLFNTENIINQVKNNNSQSPEVPSPEVPTSRGWKREPQFLSNNNKFLSNNNMSSKEDREKSPPSYGNKDINEVIKFLREELGASPDGTVKENRRFAYLLLKKFQKDYPDKDPVKAVQFLIKAALNDDFHRKNATNFKYLYYNSQKIIQSFKGRLNRIAVFKTK